MYCNTRHGERSLHVPFVDPHGQELAPIIEYTASIQPVTTLRAYPLTVMLHT